MYVALGTLLDITRAVNIFRQFNGCHKWVNWIAGKHVMIFESTINLKLVYKNNDKNLRGLVGADWGTYSIDSSPYSGLTFNLSDAVVSWESRK